MNNQLTAFSRRPVAHLGGITLAFIAGLTVLWYFDPETHRWYPPCITRTLTGLLCPGCGSARGIHALLRGDVARAVALNPLAVALVPVLVGWLAGQFWRLYRPDIPVLRPPTWLGWLLLIVITAFAIIRNVPPPGLGRAALGP